MISLTSLPPAILLFCLTVRLVAQGPINGFMVGQGRTDLALSYSYESYDQYYFGDELQAADNQIQAINLFAEHGFSDSLAIVLSIPYLWIDSLNRGLQDAVVAFKYREQPHRRLSLIASAGISFPLSAYPTDTETPIGARRTVLQGRLVVQYQFDSGLFLNIQSGYDFQVMPEAQSAIPVQLRAGFGAKHYFVEGWLEWFHTFSGGADDRILAGAGSDWLRAGGTLYIPVTPALGWIGGGAFFLDGRNIGLSSRWNTGLVIRLGNH